LTTTPTGQTFTNVLLTTGDSEAKQLEAKRPGPELGPGLGRVDVWLQPWVWVRVMRALNLITVALEERRPVVKRQEALELELELERELQLVELGVWRPPWALVIRSTPLRLVGYEKGTRKRHRDAWFAVVIPELFHA